MERTWQVTPRTHDDILLQVLANRGVKPEDVPIFLSPDWSRDIFPPSLFTRMSAAVELALDVLARGERIVIHGDYDADGVSGSSLVYLALQEVSAKLGLPFNVDVFLPDRERDGYGVAMHTIERLAGEGVKLVITVDCGIATGLELDRGQALGMQAIVCDHHQLGTHLPTFAVLLHPLAPGETYPNKTLCGTGVAFKFASGLIEEARCRGAAFPLGHEKWYLDLVAIATVTDVMPLIGENRALESFGLKVLNKTRRPGLRAIFESSGTALGEIDTQVIGFRIGPRLNAAGRLASAEIAFKAVTAPTPEEALVAAAELERLNRERQNIFAKSYAEARVMAVELVGKAKVLVVYAEHWLPGIVGLIAGRLVNDFGLPAFALTKVGEHYVGSGRTAAGLHLVEAMNACGDVFVKKGGHPQACGLTIRSEAHVHQFRDEIGAYADEVFTKQGGAQIFVIDAEVKLSEMSLAFVDRLSALEPFGEGNRQPIFTTQPLTIMAVETMGATKAHLRLTVVDETGTVAKMVGFGFGEQARTLIRGNRVEVAFETGVNVWNGRREVQLRVVDLRPISC